ncbi:response regulator transcription factor [Carboxylicivirga sp. A043]|uniref:LytR/AlgR family response regulator transcription factor n=1 Tax=Carboxylicivirga litoralis TaxID=2816963 RepID=UPI0021CB5038|nr:LytTR family DNA-binding domain-containing protein [Carboxylicivirga sp. A043]MCU4157443.1 response regulator transcription factor [Carboxylicivirga sp. A043]
MEQVVSALIVEDVPDTSDYIRQRVELLFPQIQPIQQAYDIESAYELIKQQIVNVVFLDIQLTTGTGFDLLRRLMDENLIDFEIIFITGESAKEYTLKAIKFSAIDFLYKPLDDAELTQAVNKALVKINRKAYNQQIRLLLERVGVTQGAVSNKMAFHLHSGIIEFVAISDIIYLQADGVITYVFLSGDQRLTATRNIGFYKEMLVSDYNFHSISNGLLVNQDYIKKYNHRELTVELVDGTCLYASKRFGKEFKDSFNSSDSRIKSFAQSFKKLFN